MEILCLGEGGSSSSSSEFYIIDLDATDNQTVYDLDEYDGDFIPDVSIVDDFQKTIERTARKTMKSTITTPKKKKKISTSTSAVKKKKNTGAFQRIKKSTKTTTTPPIKRKSKKVVVTNVVSPKKKTNRVAVSDEMNEEDAEDFVNTYKAKSKKRKAPEFDIQSEFTTYLEETYPDAFFCSSLAGSYMSKATMGKGIAMGFRAGYPDFNVYEMKKNGDQVYGGLFIEFKAPGKKVRPGSQQAICLKGLHERGYCVRVINNLQSAKNTVDWYLALPTPS